MEVVAAIASTIMRIFTIVRHLPNQMALMDAFVEFTRGGCALYHSRGSDRERTRIGVSMGFANCTSEGSSIIDKINRRNTKMNEDNTAGCAVFLLIMMLFGLGLLIWVVVEATGFKL